ncbi:MAG: hypothetical protein HOP28_14925 [Gemmatimonadales bacterium]|nr:hypothetical protein [Gemmatimonadales bacterium]
MRWTAPNVIGWGLLCAGCGTTVTAVPALSPGVVEEPVTALIAAALDADRRLAPADSLWDPDAAVVADGALRYAPPRFAAVEPGGDVAITSSRLEVRQSLVWVYLEYRWLSVKDGLARDAKATVLLTPKPGGGWKIVHLHSSTAP